MYNLLFGIKRGKRAEHGVTSVMGEYSFDEIMHQMMFYSEIIEAMLNELITDDDVIGNRFIAVTEEERLCFDDSDAQDLHAMHQSAKMIFKCAKLFRSKYWAMFH